MATTNNIKGDIRPYFLDHSQNGDELDANAALVVGQQQGSNEDGHGAGMEYDEDPQGNAFGGHISISLGYEAEGQAALLKMEENYVLLDQNQRKANIKTIQMQQGDGSNGTQIGTIMAEAHAIQNSANSDAQKDYIDAGNEGAQAAGSGVNTYVSAKAGPSDEYTNAQNDLNDITTFENAFNSKKPAANVISDADLPAMDNDQLVRYGRIVDGQGAVKLKPSDDLVIQHIQKDPTDSAKVTARINQAKHDATLKMNTEESLRSAKLQKYQAIVGIGQHAASMSFDFGKGAVDSQNKGPADAYRVIATAADQNVSATASQGVQQADDFEKKAADLNRVREALAQNNANASG